MGPTVYKLQIDINDWAATILAHSPAFSAEQRGEAHMAEGLNMQENTYAHANAYTQTWSGLCLFNMMLSSKK